MSHHLPAQLLCDLLERASFIDMQQPIQSYNTNPSVDRGVVRCLDRGNGSLSHLGMVQTMVVMDNRLGDMPARQQAGGLDPCPLGENLVMHSVMHLRCFCIHMQGQMGTPANFEIIPCKCCVGHLVRA